MPTPDRRLVHEFTRVSTTFGVLDRDGNIIQRITVEDTICAFTPGAFADCYMGIHAKRRECWQQIAAGRLEETRGAIEAAFLKGT